MRFFDLRPRSIGLICGSGAVGLGLLYMLAAGAPSSYLIVNLAALILGASLWLALGKTEFRSLGAAGPAAFILSLLLLATALFGTAVDGASRWIAVAGLTLQISLIVVPVALVLYARRSDTLATLAMILSALALAIQPDRAMAGALMVGLLALLVSKWDRQVSVAAASSVAAFGWTLVTPDNLPAVPYVDGILYSAFDVKLVAGLFVVIGSFLLLLPALLGVAKAAPGRSALWAFGGCWAGVLAGAALGNYPTPLVGYGGSAVLGYLLGVGLLPSMSEPFRRESESVSPAGRELAADGSASELRIARSA